MTHVFNAPRLMSLLTLALGLMAFSATTAHAELGAYWEVGGTRIETGSALLPEVGAERDSTHTTFLTTVGLTAVEILCGKMKFVGARLHPLGKFTGKIHYEECTTLLNHVAAPRCTPKTPGAAVGLIESNALDGLLKLHEPSPGIRVDLLELLGESVISLFELKLGSLCAIGNNFDITGKLFLKDCKAELLVNKTEHLLEEGPLGALLFGGNAMTIDGSFWMFLRGAHLGLEFSGHPN
jgi:hypothetical protein